MPAFVHWNNAQWRRYRRFFIALLPTSYAIENSFETQSMVSSNYQPPDIQQQVQQQVQPTTSSAPQVVGSVLSSPDPLISTQTIPDLEQRARSGSAQAPGASSYAIMNPQQKIKPTNFIKSLIEGNYKQSLVTFLFEEWKKKEYSEYFKNFSLYFTMGRIMLRIHVTKRRNGLS